MTAADIAIRPASPTDLPALLTSVAGLFEEDAGQHDPLVNVEWPALDGADYYTDLIGADSALVVLAWAGDQPAGHLIGKLGGSTSVRPHRYGVLESLRVFPAHRGHGVGGALVEHFLTWARTRGSGQAIVEVYAANVAAQRLYHRYGFSPKSVELRADL